jgi:hypothetical protein
MRHSTMVLRKDLESATVLYQLQGIVYPQGVNLDVLK